MGPIRYKGSNDFTQCLVLATLSGKPTRFDHIRPDDANPGLADYEISFLRLLEKFTNGSTIEISYTGTTLLFRPGQITGGKITHECHLTKSLGYYLEPLLVLAPFAQKPANVTLFGITTDNVDAGVDIIRTSICPVLKRFTGDDGLELRILKRGAAPLGGGQIQFLCPSVRAFPTLHLIKAGRVTRIRGIASSTRVSPANVNRLVTSARGVLNRFLSDIHIYTDARRGDECGLSPGFGLSLVAETSEGNIYSSELVGGAGSTPEEVGAMCAKMLLDEIDGGGCVDRWGARLVVLGMLLGSEDMGRVRIGKNCVDETFVALIRDIQTFFNRQIAIKEEEDDTLVLTVLGLGYVNANKGVS